MKWGRDQQRGAETTEDNGEFMDKSKEQRHMYTKTSE